MIVGAYSAVMQSEIDGHLYKYNFREQVSLGGVAGYTSTIILYYCYTVTLFDMYKTHKLIYSHTPTPTYTYKYI